MTSKHSPTKRYSLTPLSKQNKPGEALYVFGVTEEEVALDLHGGSM